MAIQHYFVFLILVSAVIHAVWNALVKVSGSRFLTLTLIQTTGTCCAFILLFFVGLPDPDIWPYLLISVVVHNFYYIFLLFCYRLGDLSEVYPIARGSSLLFIAIGGTLLAGEAPSAFSALGIGLASLGIISLTFGGQKSLNLGLKKIFAPLLTGVFISSYTVIDGLGIRASSSSFNYIVWLNFLEGLPLLFWALIMRKNDLGSFLRKNWLSGSTGGVLAVIAYALVLFSLNEGAMASVSALRETSVLFAAIIGTVFLKEKFGIRRIFSAILIVIGILLIQLNL